MLSQFVPFIFTEHALYFAPNNKPMMNVKATPSSWSAVKTKTNGLSASVRASLRWWDAYGDHQVKGTIILQRFLDTPIFRIAYDGHQVSSTKGMKGDGARVIGSVYLPVDVALPTEVEHELLNSKHACAHGLCVTFAANSDALNKLQIVIPIVRAQNDGMGNLFKEGLIYAEQVCLAFENGEDYRQL